MVMQKQKTEDTLIPDWAMRIEKVSGHILERLETMIGYSNRKADEIPVGVGRQTVAIVGRPVRLVASPWYARWVIIQAETDNTGYMVIGGASVDGKLSTRRGITLAPGEQTQILPAGDFWLDTTVAGDGVMFMSW